MPVCKKYTEKLRAAAPGLEVHRAQPPHQIAADCANFVEPQKEGIQHKKKRYHFRRFY